MLLLYWLLVLAITMPVAHYVLLRRKLPFVPASRVLYWCSIVKIKLPVCWYIWGPIVSGTKQKEKHISANLFAFFQIRAKYVTTATAAKFLRSFFVNVFLFSNWEQFSALEISFWQDEKEKDFPAFERFFLALFFLRKWKKKNVSKNDAGAVQLKLVSRVLRRESGYSEAVR